MKNITKFPKGFFKLKRKTITASEALKDAIPLEWEESDKDNYEKKNIVIQKKK